MLGGAEKQALYLANYLQNKRGCNVYIYAYIKAENSTLFYNECERYQLKNLFVVKNPLSASGKFKYLKRRVKIALFGLKLRKHQPDIIIPYLNPSSIIASLSYKIAGAKFTFWHHRGADYYRNDKIEQKAVQKAPFFIANSQNGVAELQQQFNIPKSKLFFLPNFSTIEKVNKKSNLSIKEQLKNKIVIGMIAHFREEKYQQLLVESYFQLKKQHTNIHLVLVGNVLHQPKEQERFGVLKSYIKTHKLTNYITILHNTNATEILPLLDIGVLTSKTEGMPNIIMEYMAYSLPIVTTNHAGCISLLGKKYPYFIENKVNELTEKLDIFISDKKEREKTGSLNHQKLVNNFSIENYLITLQKNLKG